MMSSRFSSSAHCATDVYVAPLVRAPAGITADHPSRTRLLSFSSIARSASLAKSSAAFTTVRGTLTHAMLGLGSSSLDAPTVSTGGTLAIGINASMKSE
jgi:hypothetical protein